MKNFVSLFGPENNSFANLFAWGLNNLGQIGDNTAINKSSPVQSTTLSWAQVSAYVSNTAAIRSDGLLYVWGTNAFGTIGNGLSQVDLVKIDSDNSWNFIGEGTSGTFFALRNDNTLWAWGVGAIGVLGNGTIVDQSVPIQIGTSTWSKVFRAASSTFAIRNDGTLWGWGANNFGQLGIGISQLSFSEVPNLSNIVYVNVSSAIDNTGKLYVFGRNSSGQLGLGVLTPTAIGIKEPTLALDIPEYPGISWAKTGFNSSHIARISSGGELFMLGCNDSGQLGDGTTITRSLPVRVGIDRSWAYVNCNNDATVAIATDGTLWSWGANQFGQLGHGDTIFRSSPTQVISAVSSWKMLGSDYAFAEEYNVAIATDGTLWSWGDNRFGQLGLGDTLNRSAPTQIGMSSWTQVTAGEFTAIAQSVDGTWWAWGRNTFGQLGDGTTVNKSSPVMVTGIPTNGFPYVSVGASHNAAIESGTGSIWVWGATDQGRAGDVNVANSGQLLVPTKLTDTIVTGNSGWSYIRAGGNVAFAIKNGKLYASGPNNESFKAVEHDQSFPVQIGTDNDWVDIGAQSHVVAIKSNGTAWVWGRNDTSELGLGDTIHRSLPVQLPAPVGVTSWVKVYATAATSFAIAQDGGLWAWGINTNGKLGTNDTLNRSVPTKIGNDSWTQITSWETNVHTAAIRSDGALFTWGANVAGQLGDGTTVNKSSPVQIGNSSWSYVATGNSHTVAIRIDGGLFTWGLNTNGQLATGSTINRSSPAQVGTQSWVQAACANGATLVINAADRSIHSVGNPANFRTAKPGARNMSFPVQVGMSSWTQVSVGNSFITAIRSDGLLFTWGVNAVGQLGLGDTINRSSPTQVGTSSWHQISAGVDHNLAIRSDRLLFAWGNGNSGRLGDGTAVSKSSPVQIGVGAAASSWAMVSAGLTHSAAIRTDGILFTWGLNSSGQLGDNTTVVKSSPVQIGVGAAASSWSMISAGGNFTVGLRVDKALFNWGLNSSGQLGDGTTVNKSSPIQIGVGESWQYAHAGLAQTFGIRENGTLFAWGANAQGRLGIGDTINRSSPVQVGTSSWTQVESKGSGTVALKYIVNYYL